MTCTCIFVILKTDTDSTFICLLSMIISAHMVCENQLLVLSSDYQLELSNDTIHILCDLIENYTYVMDIKVDSDLFSTTTMKFETTLKLITDKYGKKSLPVISRLVPLALIGAYKVQCHTIKDILSRGEVLTLQSHEVFSVASWNTQLLRYLLDYNVTDFIGSSWATISPLELAVKLQNFEAVRMIVQRGGTVCESFAPLKCNNALHYATINSNVGDLEFLINCIKLEYGNFALSKEMNMSLLQSLLSHTHAYDSTFAYSPLHISIIHCVIGLSCSVYSAITRYLSTDCQNLSLPPRILQSQTCSAYNVNTNFDDYRSWYVNQQISGWKSFYSFKLGKNNGCDLPKINVHESGFLQEFERLFVNLGSVLCYLFHMCKW